MTGFSWFDLFGIVALGLACWNYFFARHTLEDAIEELRRDFCRENPGKIR